MELELACPPVIWLLLWPDEPPQARYLTHDYAWQVVADRTPLPFLNFRASQRALCQFGRVNLFDIEFADPNYGNCSCCGAEQVTFTRFVSDWVLLSVYTRHP